MKKLELVESGKLLTDDAGLVIYWQPICDKTKDPEGVIIFRSHDNAPIGLFRVLRNEHNYKGKVSFDDIDGEVILDIDKQYATIKE